MPDFQSAEGVPANSAHSDIDEVLSCAHSMPMTVCDLYVVGAAPSKFSKLDSRVCDPVIRASVAELRAHMQSCLAALDKLDITGPDVHLALALDRLNEQFPPAPSGVSTSDDGAGGAS